MNFCRLHLSVLVVFVLNSLVALGQASRTTGTIQGVVVDQTGGAIDGARVRLSNLETNHERSAITGPTGEFVFTEVSVGVYTLVVQASGFASYRNDVIESSLGRTTFVTPRLVPARV